MDLFIAISWFVVGLYTLLIAVYTFFWSKKTAVVHMMDDTAFTFTILLPCRNEIKNLRRLLKDLESQSYSKQLIEIILIDDHSLDGSLNLARTLSNTLANLTVTSLNHGEGTGKKSALAKGYRMANSDIILTIDADCSIGKDWVASYAQAFACGNEDLILGPVQLRGAKNILQIWESLEMMGLSGIAGASAFLGMPILSNGANLGFRRATIEQIGYSLNPSLASGDDMFLLHHLKRKGKKINYLKSKAARAFIQPHKKWSELISQRVRWNSKNSSYSDRSTILIGILVLLASLIPLVSGIMSVVYPALLPTFLIQLCIKCIIDFLFLFLVSSFFGGKKMMYWFIPVQLLNILYVSLIGLIGTNKPYTWKGRDYS